MTKRGLTGVITALIVAVLYSVTAFAAPVEYISEYTCEVNGDGQTKITVAVTSYRQPVDCAVVTATIPLSVQEQNCSYNWNSWPPVKTCEWHNITDCIEYMPLVFPPTGIQGVEGEAYIIVPTEYNIDVKELTGISALPYRIHFEADCDEITETGIKVLDDCNIDDLDVSCEMPQIDQLQEGCCSGELHVVVEPESYLLDICPVDETLSYCFSFENYYIGNFTCSGEQFAGFDLGKTLCDHVGYLLDMLAQNPIELPFMSLEVSGNSSWHYPARCVENECQGDDGPTFAEEVVFSAEASRGSVELNWTVTSEQSVLGYNIMRRNGKSGKFEQVNDSMIIATGSIETTSEYSYTDSDVVNGRAFSYRLVEVDSNGTEKTHGPVEATPRVLNMN